MIYVKLRSVNLSATVTNKRSHIAEGLVDVLIKIYEKEIAGFEFVSKVN